MQGQLIHLGLEGPIFIAMLQKMRSEAFLDRIMKVGRSQIVDLVQFLSQGLGRRVQEGWIKQEALLKVLGWELATDSLRYRSCSFNLGVKELRS